MGDSRKKYAELVSEEEFDKLVKEDKADFEAYNDVIAH